MSAMVWNFEISQMKRESQEKRDVLGKENSC